MTTERPNRIQALEFIEARLLRPHPLNWRTHPPEQQAALTEVLRQIGYADALIGVRTPTGVQLLDGHLRRDEAPPLQKLPVLIVDLSDREAALLLATLDPIAAMAKTEEETYQRLLTEANLQEAHAIKIIEDTLHREAATTSVFEQLTGGPAPRPPTSADIPEELARAIRDQQDAPVGDAPRTTHECPNCGHQWGG